jgi:outer membrane autotransporter protein
MLIGGINAYYGSASADIFSMFGNGMIDTNAHGVGATLTWYDASGFYADGQAQWSWFDSDLSSSAFGSLTRDNEGSGHAYSLEIGKRIEDASGFTFVPQAQLVYGKVDFDTFTDNVNVAVVSLGKADSLRLRMGVAAETSFGSGEADGVNYGTSQTRLHAIANLYYDFDNQTTVNVSGAPLVAALEGWSGEIGVGGTYASADNTYALYAQATIATSLESFGSSHSYRGTAGFRINF